jgi:quercetin dioxygenase-like cupin family protein
MKVPLGIIAASIAALGVSAALPAQASGPYTGSGKHMMLTPADLEWKDAASVGPGVKIAVIEGPLDQKKPFTFRLRMPPGTKLAPHTHPAYERVTVLSGTLHFAHGTEYDPKSTQVLGPGAVAIMPPGAPMFGYTKEETIIQLHGEGPWGLRYLNPQDDPRNR